MATNSDKLFLQINDKKIEAKGEQLDYILKAQAEAQEIERLLEAEQQAKEELLQSAINKLAALGLSEEEAKVIIGVN